MGLVKEPVEIELTVVNQPLTEEEKQKISEYIRQQKKRKHSTEFSNPTNQKTRSKTPAKK
jgi:hypothetical protein